MLADTAYALTKTLDLDFATAVPKVKDALAEQGFGVLTEIDMAATMKKKLGHDMAPYLILGACHPPSAWDAVNAERGIGLLLPCNVVVAEEDGKVVVGAIDPDAMFQVVPGDGLQDLAADVRRRLQSALDAL